uniref:Uncharacterized protein n=1 Tax=Anguilla anguilla TaxID=7936 RepID=A0A0E9V5L2_ANGAN
MDTWKNVRKEELLRES